VRLIPQPPVPSRERRVRGAVVESEYFRFRLYGNGNLHIIFKRADLVAKANKIVADFYGKTLADARRTA
jgi:hypothetical protein